MIGNTCRRASLADAGFLKVTTSSSTDPANQGGGGLRVRILARRCGRGGCSGPELILRDGTGENHRHQRQRSESGS